MLLFLAPNAVDLRSKTREYQTKTLNPLEDLKKNGQLNHYESSSEFIAIFGHSIWIRLEIIFLVCFVYVHWIVWIFKIFESVFAENFSTNVKSNEQKHEKHFDLIFSSSQRSWDFALNIQSTQSNWRNVIDLNDYKQRQVKKQE